MKIWNIGTLVGLLQKWASCFDICTYFLYKTANKKGRIWILHHILTDSLKSEPAKCPSKNKGFLSKFRRKTTKTKICFHKFTKALLLLPIQPFSNTQDTQYHEYLFFVKFYLQPKKHTFLSNTFWLLVVYDFLKEKYSSLNTNLCNKLHSLRWEKNMYRPLQNWLQKLEVKLHIVH